MRELIQPFVEEVISFLQDFGLVAGMLLVILESIIPILPLGVFVAFNFSAYGILVGFFLSYFSTILGCLLAYFLSQKLLGFYVKKKSREYERLNRVVEIMKNIRFSRLVLIVALPFAPAFLINIASGMVKLNLKKFVMALLIGKITIICFWGFVGKSFIESVGDWKAMLFLLVFLSISYLISMIVSRKMKLE